MSRDSFEDGELKYNHPHFELAQARAELARSEKSLRAVKNLLSNLEDEDMLTVGELKAALDGVL